ncbi:hypothetical protein KAFR_0D03200 [Kazachstania africana CBS 2517]|uniref:non-specific serine/threonine protein kinase n=1 Tax=Kazachstania africana (strain ATCC 22294 / BCRC 22015 / CBS 2517 / CECT 1963 / NBRC 1671 / NRRL Y-8276) TaxID=1071382 RepID=H2AUB8_KAZAF|nr:hypothetical protein KAFR_0D03200 [Kazachstania africana CBS 2517]CCF57968.1 hypothetical protein KAFR_0D03200 [Kazachstania africana CBS 2517]
MPSSVIRKPRLKKNTTLAQSAARKAMLRVSGLDQDFTSNLSNTSNTTPTVTHLERVVQSVSDATKRLSQAESTFSTVTKSSKRKSRDTVGPWKLGKTLGKGSSGRVRLAKNMETGQLAAIKIVPKTKIFRKQNDNSFQMSSYSSNDESPKHTNNNDTYSKINPYGIEREIVIMKLISHPNVMGLYEVWENKSELFLVLEYVDGGELFDYLVSRGKLSEREAVHYFKQIIEGVSYCHSFNICHRDLKPENLLLDKKINTIKIADFGMAALELPNKLLVTSCGSPHYASPEIVMGKSYHGSPSDVWSCGIILFALLTGHLPFNDDSIKKLLLKVQSGKFQMPQNISLEAEDLISRILVVDPEKRIQINDILIHPLIRKYEDNKTDSNNVSSYKKSSKSNSNLHILNDMGPSIVTLKARNEIDESILKNLQILWHGTSRELIISKLLQTPMSEEKLFYSLLLQYKKKNSIPLIQHTNHEASASNSPVSQSNSENGDTKSIRKPTTNDEWHAPKLDQKSQFSIPALVRQESATDVPSLPPAVSIFPASSSRSFRKSGSILSMSSKKSIKVSHSRTSLNKNLPFAKPVPPSVSKSSLHKSMSRKKLNGLGIALRTLKNSESKRSLYSLQSISKRSLNLNEYLVPDTQTESVPKVGNDFITSSIPPLPKLDSNNEFEILCEQILFGNALDEILEEEEKDEEMETNDTLRKIINNENSSSVGKFSKESLKGINNVTTTPNSTFNDSFNSTNLNSFDENLLETNSNSVRRTVQPLSLLDPSRCNALKDITNFNTQSVRVEGKTVKKSDHNGSYENKRIDSSRLKKPSVEEMRLPKKGYTNFQNIRISSAPNSNMVHQSLDPRRNFTQPEKAKVSSLLKHLVQKSNSNYNLVEKNRPGECLLKDSESSINSRLNSSRSDYNKFFDKMTLRTTTTNASIETGRDPSILAHSSTLQKPLVSLPSAMLNQSTTFRDLSKFLEDDSQEDSMMYPTKSSQQFNFSSARLASVKKIPPSIMRLDLPTNQDLNEEYGSSFISRDLDDISDITFAMEMPTNTFTAHAIHLSNNNSVEEVASDKDDLRNGEHADDIKQISESETFTPRRSNENDRINIFEDASLNSSSTTASSSSSRRSETNVHKKVVSIDTLNTTNLVTPTTDVRVSLYVNHNNATSNKPLPRETTEELISRFKFFPDRPTSHDLHKRLSIFKSNNGIHMSQSVLSMFKDLEEDQDTVGISQADLLESSFDTSLKKDKKTKDNRVTLLFDDDEINKPLTETDPKEKVDQQEYASATDFVNETNKKSVEGNIHSKNAKKKDFGNKTSPETKLMVRATDRTQKKQTWLSKLFGGFGTHSHVKLVQDHTSKVPFDDVHLLMLNEFGKNGIDYHLRNLDRKNGTERVEYDCKFVQGNFRFKIKITFNGNSTIVTVKKRSKSNKNNEFVRFNDNISQVLDALEKHQCLKT